MTIKRLIFALLALLLVLPACSTTPPADAVEKADNGAATESGNTEGKTKATEVSSAAAVATAVGDASSTNTHSSLTKPTTSTNGGPNVTGISLSARGAGAAGFQQQIDADPILQRLIARYDGEAAKESPDEAVLDALLVSMADRMKLVEKSYLKATGGDFSSLETVIVQSHIHMTSGQQDRQLTTAEATAARDGFALNLERAARIVQATKGDEVEPVKSPVPINPGNEPSEGDGGTGQN